MATEQRAQVWVKLLSLNKHTDAHQIIGLRSGVLLRLRRKRYTELKKISYTQVLYNSGAIPSSENFILKVPIRPGHLQLRPLP